MEFECRDKQQERKQRSLMAMRLSAAVAILMLVGKTSAFLITGSAAILSDAMESMVHIVGTGVSALSLALASRPPDENHPYGHDRVIVFSIGLEGALIFGAAVVILIEAITELIQGPELEQLGTGLLITAFLLLVNLALGLHLLRTGEKYNSPVVTANGKHVLTDMWTSVAVLFGIGVVWITDVVWLDPVIAIFAAVHIAHTGAKLMRSAVATAMDEANVEVTERLQALLERSKEDGEIVDYHQLRHRELNGNRWIEFHLLLPSELTIREGHDRATRIETNMRRSFPREQLFITSHLEPAEHETVHPRGHDLSDPLGKKHGRV